MAKAKKVIWDIDGLDIPVHIYKEWRDNNRISIGKDKVIMRVANLGPGMMTSSFEGWARDWIRQQLRLHPEIKTRLVGKSYPNGYVIQLPEKSYQLQIRKEDRKTSAAKLISPEVIRIALNHRLSQKEISKSIETLCSRIIAQDNHERVEHRIRLLNDRYIREHIKTVRLKNNNSNWGSCSSSGNINISTKTLFAPPEVRDYVYIHELAHLKELNHSSRFWSIVADIMPDYGAKEKWLKEKGHLCRI